MGLRVRGCLVDAIANALHKISCADPDRLNKQRQRSILHIVKSTQIDEGVLAGVAKQGIDKGRDGIAVGLRERSHNTLVRRMMGDEGQPNLLWTSSMKPASRCPSHWR